MVDGLVLGKRCPQRDDRARLCSLLTSAVYYVGSRCEAGAQHCVGMGLPADNNHCCLCNRNSSKLNPHIVAQAPVPLPALKALIWKALQKLTSVQNWRIHAHLPAHLQKWMWILESARAGCRHSIYS